MGRRKAKITITISERVIRNYIIHYLLKIPIIQISHGINKHIYFIGKFHILLDISIFVIEYITKISIPGMSSPL